MNNLQTDIEIVDDVEQGSAEWKALRVGMPTASNFSAVLAGGDGKVRGLYMRKLAGEIMTGEPAENFRSRAMERGSEQEASLRATFEIETGLRVRQIAFARRRRPYGMIGASPDGLIGDDCGLEIKSTEPHLLIEILKSGRVPPEHLPQVHGNMLVTGASSWWFAIGYPGMPQFRRKVFRDSSYCARLEVALDIFSEELLELVQWIRAYGRQP